MPPVLFEIFRTEFYHQHKVPKHRCCSGYCSYKIGSSALTKKTHNFWRHPNTHPPFYISKLTKHKQTKKEVTTCSEDKDERWILATETKKYML